MATRAAKNPAVVTISRVRSSMRRSFPRMTSTAPTKEVGRATDESGTSAIFFARLLNDVLDLDGELFLIREARGASPRNVTERARHLHHGRSPARRAKASKTTKTHPSRRPLQRRLRGLRAR